MASLQAMHGRPFTTIRPSPAQRTVGVARRPNIPVCWPRHTRNIAVGIGTTPGGGGGAPGAPGVGGGVSPGPGPGTMPPGGGGTPGGGVPGGQSHPHSQRLAVISKLHACLMNTRTGGTSYGPALPQAVSVSPEPRRLLLPVQSMPAHKHVQAMKSI